MTGESRYLVRHEFTESATWRDALGNAAQLLAFADQGYCLDAPEYVPAGGMQSGEKWVSAQFASRF